MKQEPKEGFIFIVIYFCSSSMYDRLCNFSKLSSYQVIQMQHGIVAIILKREFFLLQNSSFND